MNAYKLNSIAGYITRKAIREGLNIQWTEIYKTVKDITDEGIITTKDGKKYKLKLEEIQ